MKETIFKLLSKQKKKNLMKIKPFSTLHSKFYILTTLIILHFPFLMITAYGSYTDNGNYTITDNKTGLIWQKCSMGTNTDSTCSDDGDSTNNTVNWVAALSYCEDLNLGGNTSWRLPNINELESLVDDSITSPSINTDYFPGTFSSYYWSSSTYVGSTSNACYVHFNNGYAPNNLKAHLSYVRCVSGP